MKTLFVFDGGVRSVDAQEVLRPGMPVDLFPLTGDWEAVDRLTSALTDLGLSPNTLDSAREIDAAVDGLQKKLGPWSEALGNRTVEGRTLKQWLKTPGGETTAWWLTLLSEKNPLKTDVFLRLAQLEALDLRLGSGDYDACLVAGTDPEWARLVSSAAERRGVAARKIAAAGGRGWRAWAKARLKVFGLWGELAQGAFRILQFAGRGVRARAAMGPLPRRKKEPGALLFITYFPALDAAAAREGIFRNRYAAPLQDLLRRRGQGVNWLLMTVAYEGLGFGAALRLGRTFARAGEAVFFLEEFFGLSQTLACLRAWIRLIRVHGRIARAVAPGFWAQGLSVPEGDILLARLWRRSLVGGVGAEGAACLESFKGVFDFFPDAGVCLYLMEMQAWEKALNAARRGRAGALTVGFQHSAFSRNYFSHYHTAGEIGSSGQAEGLPLPDVVACNGDIPREAFLSQGYPSVRKLEAIRQLHVLDAPANARKSRPPILLVVGAYDKEIMKSLLRLVCRAFPSAGPVEVWVKPHPAADLGKVLRETGIGLGRPPFKIVQGAMETLLAEASFVVVGDSSVAVEALAYGCRVLLPVFANALFMSALSGPEEVCKKVYNPAELAQAVAAYGSTEMGAGAAARARRFVESYWHLDRDLAQWEALLAAPRAAAGGAR